MAADLSAYQIMLIDPIEAIADALRDKRPLVLFAGQNHDPSTDPLLANFIRHLGTEDCSFGWRSALDHGISPAQMEWLSERFDRSVPSDTVTPIYDVAWSAVFTSSIDPRFSRRFETRGRQPESVLSRGTYARVPRSRSRPPIYYLLGKSDETSPNERAPQKHSDLQRRLSHATELLNRIADTATVRGLVVITGYVPDKDWMQADWLFAPLSNGVSPAVLWFDFRGAPNSSVTEEMIHEGSITTTKMSLTYAISQLESRGLLDLATAAGPDEPGMVSLPGGAVLDITPALRLRVEASAAIVDDSWTEDPEPLVVERDSDDHFRRFHSTLGNFRLLLEGIARGFAIERSFEQTLWKTVNGRVKRVGQPDTDAVVILHGQSGTGKSVALARLIGKIRRELQLPVVVATGRIPTHGDIEEFCLASEDLNAPATVLICDANQGPQRYDDLASALRSRGRRLLIVGTCYRMDSDVGGHSDRFVEAPDKVDHTELAAFERLPSSFVQHDTPSGSDATSSIFYMLYRRLPPSHARLAAGVSAEARNTEGLLRQRARNMPRSTAELPALALQLIDAGLVSQPAFFAEDDTLASIGQDWAGLLIEYVMAPGRLNCPVPVDLLFRTLSQIGTLESDQIISLISHLDLFRWMQDEEGADNLIRPRLQIEAEFICRRRFITTDQEIRRLVDLICNARPGIERRAERSFLLNLLFLLDRGGPRGEAYQSGYLQFADALRQVRERHRLTDPDLVLRESVLRRRAVQAAGRADDEHLEILHQALETVDQTLEEIDNEGLRVSARTRRSLVSERAAIFGYLAVQRARSQSDKGYWSDYLAASVASERAIGIDQSFHPIDIALWTATNVLELKRDRLSTSQRAELQANLYAAIDLGDEVVGVANGRRARNGIVSRESDVHRDGDLDHPSAVVNQSDRYLERRARVALAVGDQRLDDKTLRELDGVAPATSTYLVARREAACLYGADLGSDDEMRHVAGNAADYISGRVDSGVELDVRCLRLLLQLRWFQSTGERLLLRRRGGTPVREVALQELLGIVSDLNQRAGSHARSRERFLEAVLSWLLKDTSRAIDIWDSLSDDTKYQDSSRVIRWLVMTDKSGATRQFRGRLERESRAVPTFHQKNRTYWVRVEEIGRSIPLLAHEFPNDDLDHGRELRFGISFNYIGPLAEPLSRPMRRR